VSLLRNARQAASFESLEERIEQAVEQRVVRDPGWTAWANSNGGVPGSSAVDGDRAMQLLAVYGCVQLITDSIATLPIDVYRQNPDGSKVELPLPRWMAWESSPGVDRVDFLSRVLVSLLLDGNAYLVPGRNANGVVVEVYVLDPAVVEVRRHSDGRVAYIVDGREVVGLDVLHVRGMCAPGELKGVNPIEAARQMLAMGLAANASAEKFFTQGAVIPGVIEAPGSMTREQMRDMRDNWVVSHGGVKRSHLPGILTNGATWRSVSITAEQAQFLQTRRYTDAQIAGQLFRVDPTLLGIPVEGTSLTYNNVESRGIHLARHTLMPWVVRVERALGRLLPANQYARFNMDGLMRADLSTRYASYKTGLEAGFLTVDEVRRLEDLELLPDIPAATDA
jgi:HK97 family phage portal protein